MNYELSPDFFQEVVYDIDTLLSIGLVGRVEHKQSQQLEPSPYQADPPILPMTTVITHFVVIMGSSTFCSNHAYLGRTLEKQPLRNSSLGNRILKFLHTFKQLFKHTWPPSRIWMKRSIKKPQARE